MTDMNFNASALMDLIARLERARESFASTSRAAKQLTDTINNLNRVAQQFSGKKLDPKTEKSIFAYQEAISSGTGERINIPDIGRFRTKGVGESLEKVETLEKEESIRSQKLSSVGIDDLLAKLERAKQLFAANSQEVLKLNRAIESLKPIKGLQEDLGTFSRQGKVKGELFDKEVAALKSVTESQLSKTYESEFHGITSKETIQDVLNKAQAISIQTVRTEQVKPAVFEETKNLTEGQQFSTAKIDPLIKKIEQIKASTNPASDAIRQLTKDIARLNEVAARLASGDLQVTSKLERSVNRMTSTYSRVEKTTDRFTDTNTEKVTDDNLDIQTMYRRPTSMTQKQVVMADRAKEAYEKSLISAQTASMSLESEVASQEKNRQRDLDKARKEQIAAKKAADKQEENRLRNEKREAQSEANSLAKKERAWEKGENATQLLVNARNEYEESWQKDAKEQAKIAQGALKSSARYERAQLPTKEEIRAQAKAAETQQRIQNLPYSLPGGKDTANRVLAMAQSYDFAPETLKSVKTQAPTGIHEMRFSYMDENKVVQSLDIAVDRFGGTLVKTQRRLQDFFSGVGRNVIEFAKWSLAVTLVLGPLAKLNEMTKTAIENQAQLADITVALANSQKSVNEIYSAAAKIAQDAGEEITGVLEAYNLAYRATGGLGTETERFAAANKLLADSLVLSKLSSLDQAEAIDILAASLKQTGKGFDEGRDLLDTWVKTTRIANVDLATLATSFAITGDAAEAAKLDMEELNGLIAAVAETGVASGKEAGNTVRAIIAGFGSERARKELDSLGVSIEDSGGKLRKFTDIMGDVQSLRTQNIIDDKQFSDLTLALGGGYRRQAVWTTLIDNFGRVGEISSMAANASGEASEAMAIKLGTVETASTRLGNAFEGLANTLGTSGGLLDVFTTFLNLGTGIVNVLDSIVNSIGKVTPVLGLALGASAFIGTKTPQWRQAQASKMGQFAGNATDILLRQRFLTHGLFNKQVQSRDEFDDLDVSGRLHGLGMGDFEKTDYKTKLPRRNQISQGVTGFITKKPDIALGAMALGLSATNTLLDDELTGGQKTGKIATQIIGGIAGGIIAQGNPIGVIIGSAIAEAFVSKTLGYKPKFENFFGIQQPGDKSDKPDESPEEQKLREEREQLEKDKQDLLNDAFKEQGFGILPVGKMLASLGAMGMNLPVQAQSLFTGKEPEFEMTPELYALTYGDTIKADVREPFNNTKELKERFDELAGRADAERGLDSDVFENLHGQVQKQYQEVYESVQETFRRKLLDELLERELNPTAYKAAMERINRFNVTGTQYYAAFGEQFAQAEDLTPETTFQQFANIESYSSPEELTQLKALANEIAILQAQLAGLTAGTAEYNAKAKELNNLQQDAVIYTQALTKAVAARKNLADVMNLGEFTKEQIDLIIERAARLQGVEYAEQFKQGFIESMEDMESKKESISPFLIKGKEDFYFKQEELEQRFVSEATKELKDEGILPKEEKIGFQKFDITQADFAKEIESRYEPTVKLFESMGYKSDKQTEIAIFKDGIITPMTKDWKIVQYLLGEILDVNKKQLQQGLYNFPEGMFPVVPFTGYEKGFPQGESTIKPVIDMALADQQAQKLQEVKDNMKELPPQPVNELLPKLVTVELPKEQLPKIDAVTGQDMAIRWQQAQMIKPQEKDADYWEKYYTEGGWITKPLEEKRSDFSFDAVIKPLDNSFQGIIQAMQGLSESISGGFKSLFGIGDTQKQQEVSTSLKLNINQTVALQVDARQLASIINQYTAENLVRYSNQAGSTLSLNIIT
jgi:TP901 family phage tail tape measure protein